MSINQCTDKLLKKTHRHKIFILTVLLIVQIIYAVMNLELICIKVFFNFNTPFLFL